LTYDEKELPQTIGGATDFVSDLAMFAGTGIGCLTKSAG
jgi:hypothetical protein